MKVKITGASHFVNRMFEACGSYQWAREFVRNSIEASATRVEFGIEWQAVQKLGVYRRTIIDNGCGMDQDELLRFFSTLGDGGKKIGGVHDNYGVGAKIASLPWNPKGVVVISYRENVPAMIIIRLDEESGDYELTEFDMGGKMTCVINPEEIEWGDEIDWGNLRPDWLTKNGTIIVLLGSDEYPDSILGNPNAGEQYTKGLSMYLNTRFWDLSKIIVRVVELRSDKKNQWPQGRDDKDDSRRPNSRQIMGARYFLSEVDARSGKPSANDVVMTDDSRVAVEWYLWEGERPSVHGYAKEGGYIAIRYRDELFHVTSDKYRFRWFGVIENSVQRNLTIIIEPQHFTGGEVKWGIYPDQSRNTLLFTGNGEKGVQPPLADWGSEFLESMPGPIREAIAKARGEVAATLEDDEYRKRLQDKFGDRWRMKVLVQAKGSESGEQTIPATISDQEVVVFRPSSSRPPRRRPGTRSRTPGTARSVQVVRKKAVIGGDQQAIELDAPVDVPLIRFMREDNFEKPWHIAAWIPNDPDGPTVYINVDAPVLKEAIAHHQSQYPDVYADTVAETVQKVFGEVAACKVAHSQKLLDKVSEQELDSDYRNEAALTVALMGLLAEESLIAQRLGRLGKKKTAI